jgi:hypothetical protein
MRTILVRLLLAMFCALGTELAVGQSTTSQPVQTVRQSEQTAQSGTLPDGMKAGEEMNGDASPKEKAKTKKNECIDRAKQKQSYEDFYNGVFELNKTI